MRENFNLRRLTYRASGCFFLALTLFANINPAVGGDLVLRTGYFMCKDAPLQLRWFTGFSSSTKFMDAGAATEVPLSDANKEAQKALATGWCASTDGMELFSINRIEPCDDAWNQIPNGGCVKVTVSPRASNFQSSWYTFKNAINQ